MWKKMVDLNDRYIQLPHDGYVKLWQLIRPQLDSYSVLMIDEAQDLTPGEISLSELGPVCEWRWLNTLHAVSN